jgi:hypothetical protein
VGKVARGIPESYTASRHIKYPQLPVATRYLDALDLFFNQHGIGWSWSPTDPRPFLPREYPSTFDRFRLGYVILENHGARHDTVHLAFNGPIHRQDGRRLPLRQALLRMFSA